MLNSSSLPFQPKAISTDIKNVIWRAGHSCQGSFFYHLVFGIFPEAFNTG
jgi:hypothetical protein